MGAIGLRQLLAAAVAKARDALEARRVGEARLGLDAALVEEAARIRASIHVTISSATCRVVIAVP